MLLSLGSLGAFAAPTVPVASGGVLPYNSPLLFTLLDPVSSISSRANQIVRLKLKAPLILAGRTIAPAGTPGTLRIVDARAAESGDTYGYVDVVFEALVLPNQQRLPLGTPRERLQIVPSAGHQSTVGIEDSIENSIIPYHMLYEAFRKGKNFELRPGATVRARTQATLSLLPNGALAIATPGPIPVAAGTPFATFPVAPIATPGNIKERITAPPIYTPPPTQAPPGAPPSIGPGGPDGGPGSPPTP